MNTLIVDDDLTCSLLLQGLLKDYGPSHVAANGREAVEAVRIALEAGEPYNLICLDIMMPEMGGQEALRKIRLLEETMVIAGLGRAKIIMTTALSDKANVIMAGQQRCDLFLVKPIQKEKLLEDLRRLELIP